MPDPTDDDWRLRGQEDDLLDAKLVRKAYRAPRPDWDHDHCEFCWAKFMDSDTPGVQRIGYTTAAGNEWICDTCFADFQSRFRWTVESNDD